MSTTERLFTARVRYLLAGEATRRRMDGLPAAPRPSTTPSSTLVCPHCQARGTVVRQTAHEKAGVSGGKLAAMFLTAGISLVFTGLSRKQTVTRAFCVSCGQHWTIG